MFIHTLIGVCLATFDDADTSVTQLTQLAGRWWILKGLNCGQDDIWYGGFDYYPCQSDEFVISNEEKSHVWIDNIAYCGGNNNTCTTPMLHTSANVSIDHPGVMHHEYLDAPLLPQTEDWIVLSHFEDWMLYIYCGSTPAGGYAGGSVVSRVSRVITDIPVYIEDNFRMTAKKFGFNYDDMCISDCTTCSSR